MASPTFIALLRAINVGGHNRILMAELRALAAGLGWLDVQSYLQSGNLVFSAAGRPSMLEDALERAIEDRLGLSVPVIVREARDWAGYVVANPFPAVSTDTPSLVMLALSKAPPRAEAAEELQARAVDGEQVRQAGNALWIHYAGGSGRSRLSPGVLDRVVGSTVTTRNWRTVAGLATMAGVDAG